MTGASFIEGITLTAGSTSSWMMVAAIEDSPEVGATMEVVGVVVDGPAFDCTRLRGRGRGRVATARTSSSMMSLIALTMFGMEQPSLTMLLN